MEQLSLFDRNLMLDRKKVLGELPMTFSDFRRISLIADYLELYAFHEMVWDLYADFFIKDISCLLEKCENQHEDIPYLLSEARQWLADFRAQAPNETVNFLLRKVFSQKLETRSIF